MENYKQKELPNRKCNSFAWGSIPDCWWMTAGLWFSFFPSRSDWITVLRFYATEKLYKGEYKKRQDSKPTSHICLLTVSVLCISPHPSLDVMDGRNDRKENDYNPIRRCYSFSSPTVLLPPNHRFGEEALCLFFSDLFH